MWKLFRVAAIALMLLPVGASALCNNDDYSVIFVNGVLTSRQDADDEKDALQREFSRRSAYQNVEFLTGYNPSHLAGGGDLLESITQALGAPISNYDLDTILMQIHSEVTTRKILLVGYSQGTFYTNEMYDYLTSHGVPKESIAVYNIATPASFVAGGGQYLTSTNDKLINAIRDAEVNGNVRTYADSYYTIGGVVASALRANITIPKESGWDSSDYGGHGLSDAYLAGAASRIVSDINFELKNLKAVDAPAVPDGCFTPPAPTIAYQAQQAALAIGDPLAAVSSAIGSVTTGGVFAIAESSRGVLADALPAALHSLTSLFGSPASSTSQAAVAALAADAQSDTSVSQSSRQVAVAAEPATAAGVVSQVEPETRAQPIPVSEVSSVPAPDPALPASSASPSQTLIPVGTTPGFGGGGPNVAPEQDSPSQSVAPASAVLSVDAPADHSYIASTTVAFSGTADAGATITANVGTTSATTTADDAGNWSLLLPLAEGVAQVSVGSVNTTGIASPIITRSVTVDVTAPSAPAVSVSECGASLSPSFCLVATTTLTIAWDNVDDAASYAVVSNGSPGATTTATSSSVQVAADATTTLAVIAYDSAGNAATSTGVAARTISRPVVINEIAWGGDNTDHSHQWIELKNISPYTLDISHVSLARSGGTPIALSGTIPSVGDPFLIVEPMDIPFTRSQKIITPFAPLATTAAEQLSLVWNASTTLDSSPAAGTCPGWCAGAYNAKIGSNASGINDLYSPLSMERVSGAVDGTLAASWRDTDSYGPWLGVSNTAALWGTPGSENSWGLPDAGVYCGAPDHLVQANQPYHPDVSSCVFLSRFITGGGFGANRIGGLYRGDVASSTAVGSSHMTKGLVDTANQIIPADAQPGEHFFFAIWEQRTFANYDTSVFDFYFTQGASSTRGITGPPHGNYVTIPWTYQP
jgi:hypothetical protein